MSEAIPLIDIRPDHWEIVRDILKKHVPQYEVWAFGSRAKWNAKQYSDLDLAIITDKPLSLAVSAALADDFSESDLPWKVDVVDWAATSESFRKIIERDKVVVQEGKQSSNMAGEWTTASLDSLCEQIIDCPHSTPVWTPNGVIVLRSQNIRGGRLDLSSPSYTDEEHFQDRIRRAQPKGGDLVITREAPMGEVCQIPSGLRCCLGQRMVLLRPDRSLADGRYLLFALQSRAVRTQIMWAEGTGSTVSNLRIPDLKKLKIPSPPLPEQRAIAHILGTLDDKIELNRRSNETLEAMARALFKDWFVDFGPVRAKMEGREPYLPADIWQLFPDRLDDEGKPEGWESKRVSDFLTLAYGKSLPAGKRNHGNIPVYGSGGITGFHDESLLNEPAIIVGRKGTVGSLYWEDRPSFPIDTVFYVHPVVPLSFCYYLLDSLPLRSMNTDAAVPGLNRENVYRLEVAEPPAALIFAFSETAARLRESIATISRDSEILAQLRDTLLPKLISGELRIKDAERWTKDAV